MFTLFAAVFGDIKISKIKVRDFKSGPTEENEIFVTLWDTEELLHKTTIPKGECSVTKMVKVPASCPHCQKELPMGFARFDDLKDFETLTYHGATIKAINKVANDEYVGDVVELRIKYETVEYKNHITNQIMVMNATQK